MEEGFKYRKVTLNQIYVSSVGWKEGCAQQFLANQFGKYAKFMVTQVVEYSSLPPCFAINIEM